MFLLRRSVTVENMECETCTYYTYDEDDDEYYCSCYMDQDDVARLENSRSKKCPYWRSGDEYAVVKHQM